VDDTGAPSAFGMQTWARNAWSDLRNVTFELNQAHSAIVWRAAGGGVRARACVRHHGKQARARLRASRRAHACAAASQPLYLTLGDPAVGGLLGAGLAAGAIQNMFLPVRLAPAAAARRALRLY
jgi:hypothetical protein